MTATTLGDRRPTYELFSSVLFDSLKAQFPAMTETDIVVCREVYMLWHDEVPRLYCELVTRLEDWFEEKDWETTRRGVAGKSYAEVSTEVSNAICRARERGYVDFGIHIWGNEKHGFRPYIDVSLRADIFDALESTRYSGVAKRLPDFDVEVLAVE